MRIAAALLMFILSTTSASAEMIGALLVADDSDCRSGHMVFSTNFGFVNAEWFGGVFTEGQLYLGEFHSYGMTDVYDESGDEVGRLWVDDFWVSNHDASEFCYRD